VFQIVKDCTDDKSLSKHAQKEQQVLTAASKCRAARALKIADKICNIRDIAGNPPKGWTVERKERYLDWAEKVVNELKGTSPNLEANFFAELSKSMDKLNKEKDKKANAV